MNNKKDYKNHITSAYENFLKSKTYEFPSWQYGEIIVLFLRAICM